MLLPRLLQLLDLAEAHANVERVAFDDDDIRRRRPAALGARLSSDLGNCRRND